MSLLMSVLLSAGVLALILGIGQLRWQTATKEMRRRLEAARLPTSPRVYDENELTVLPPPVRRYFLDTLKNGQPMVSAVHMEHSGTFNMSETGENWKPFRSVQRVVANRPGFDWEGRIAMMPGLSARVHDAYIAGEGILHASLLGLVSLVNLRGTPEVAQGELMRFFAEAAWYPTALLPSQGVHWEGVNDRSARATLKDGEIELTMLFRFNEEGRIESVRAEERGRTVSGSVIPTPWEGRWSDYQFHEGMRVPMSGEVAWILPQGRRPYWRGRITRLRYEFATMSEPDH